VTVNADAGHVHQATLETTLEFINTLEHERVADVEGLPTPAAAAQWLTDRGLAHASEARRALRPKVALERVHRVRAAMREIAESAADARPADPAALAEVNRALRARSTVELIPAADGISVGHRHVGDPLDDALATLIEPLAREIASGRRDRLRVCANDACRWVFFDESRTGRRRWCDMSTCGNRAKAARHRARRQSASSAAGAAGAAEG
jgi:predicted RNA-binding Zn ribbon-like protein